MFKKSLKSNRCHKESMEDEFTGEKRHDMVGGVIISSLIGKRFKKYFLFCGKNKRLSIREPSKTV